MDRLGNAAILSNDHGDPFFGGAYLIVVVQVRLGRWWPKELPLVGERIGLQGLRNGGLCCRYGRRRLQDICRMDAVAVLLPFPQLAADKTDRYHCAVAADHFTRRAPF